MDPDAGRVPRRYQKPHRTVTGRVVYTRPVHVWTYADMARIVRSLRPIEKIGDGIRTIEAVYLLVERLRDAIAANLYAIQIGDRVASLLRQIAATILLEIDRSIDPQSPAHEAILKVVDILYTL